MGTVLGWTSNRRLLSSVCIAVSRGGHLLCRGRYRALVPFLSCTDCRLWRAPIFLYITRMAGGPPNYYYSCRRFQHAARLTSKWLAIRLW